MIGATAFTLYDLEALSALTSYLADRYGKRMVPYSTSYEVKIGNKL